MRFNPNLIEAELALGRIGPDDVPALAWDAVEAGFDVLALAEKEEPAQS